MRHGRLVAMVLALSCVAAGVAGCGNVHLTGEALTAAENSAMDALQASRRADADEATADWQKAYLAENFLQWRWFVRAARREDSWGPKLPAECPDGQPAPSNVEGGCEQ